MNLMRLLFIDRLINKIEGEMDNEDSDRED